MQPSQPPLQTLTISPVHPEHTLAVLAFETENREYFEQWITTRGDDYYNEPSVMKSLEHALVVAHLGQERHYLVWLESEVVGRVTLRHIDQHYLHQATLGYRFSQRHAGQGFATAAVNTVMSLACTNLHLLRLNAVVAEGNTASQRIMEKCHFRVVNRTPAHTILKGKQMDVLHYTRELT